MPMIRIAVALSGLVLSSAVCNTPQCPNPPLNITALAPCMGQTVPPSCCTQISPLASNPCIRVWLQNPQIAPFQAQIAKAAQACKITSLPECRPQVKSVCSAECNSLPAGLGANSSASGSSTNASSLNASSANSSTGGVASTLMPPCNATQCKLPTLNATALASCMGPTMSQNCCVQARALAMDPCIRVWIQLPQLVSFQAQILSAGQACNITNLADCTQQVKRICPIHCTTVPNATNATSMNSTQGGSSNDTCPNQFEEWTDCHSSSCWESKCVDGKLQKTGPICTTDCRSGCRCKDGYARLFQTDMSNSNMRGNSRRLLGGGTMDNSSHMMGSNMHSSNQTCILEIQCGLNNSQQSSINNSQLPSVNNSQPPSAVGCPMFRCALFCTNGFVKDANGCSLCQCQQSTGKKAGKQLKGKKAKAQKGGRR